MDRIAFSDLFMANETQEIKPPPLPHNQQFKKSHGVSKRMLINMRKSGCKTIEEYRDYVKRRKRRERLHQKIKHNEVRAGRSSTPKPRIDTSKKLSMPL